MKLKFLPQSYLGKWSVGLIVVMPILFYIGMSFVGFYESVPAGKTIPHDVIARPGIALPMLTGFVFGIASFSTGITATIKRRDRSIIVFIATLVGFLVLLWCLAEIIFPH
jgi:uncharacterized membrane protein YhaH (DUF805 family)